MPIIVRRSNRSLITKKVIDLMIDFLRDNFQYNRMYNNIKITDRFSRTAANLPAIVVRQTTNSGKRTDFTDYMYDIIGRVGITPLDADNLLVGNNVQRTNLPMTIDWVPLRPFDNTFGLPPGSDIMEVAFTSTSGTTFPSGISTGIIVTVPPPTIFAPSSILYTKEDVLDPMYYPGVRAINYNGLFNLAIGRTNDQFYFIYSGNTYSDVYSGSTIIGTSGTGIGPVILPVGADQYIVNPSGMSGVTIKLSDVLFAGDQYQIQTYAADAFIAERYGGYYNITINFDLYADSTLELQELTDFTERFLLERKFDLWDKAGFNSTSWSKGSESEKAYLNEFIFQSSVTIEGYTEWFEDRASDLVDNVIILPIPVGGYDISGNSVQMMYFVPSGSSLPSLNGNLFSGGDWAPMGSGQYWAPVGVSGAYIPISGAVYNSIFYQLLPSGVDWPIDVRFQPFQN